MSETLLKLYLLNSPVLLMGGFAYLAFGAERIYWHDLFFSGTFYFILGAISITLAVVNFWLGYQERGKIDP